MRLIDLLFQYKKFCIPRDRFFYDFDNLPRQDGIWRLFCSEKNKESEGYLMHLSHLARFLLIALILFVSNPATIHAFSILDTGNVSGGNPGGQTIYAVTELKQGDTFALTWLGFAGIGIDGIVSINSLSSNTANIKVNLNNNSDPIGVQGDPRITSFGLSVGSFLGFNVGTAGQFLDLFDDSNFPGFQDVVVCASSGNNCAGGGNGGIDVGFSDSFIFSLSGNFGVTPLLTLNDFAIKVQGGPNGQSFELAGTPRDPGTPIPEPSSLLLLGSGIVGLAMWRRRQ
ncbi:MAG: cistern family PEP-CTERM protein [Candidatus Binatia bacterium]